LRNTPGTLYGHSIFMLEFNESRVLL